VVFSQRARSRAHLKPTTLTNTDCNCKRYANSISVAIIVLWHKHIQCTSARSGYLAEDPVPQAQSRHKALPADGGENSPGGHQGPTGAKNRDPRVRRENSANLKADDQSLARLGPLLAIAASPLQQDFQDLTGCCCVAGFCLDPKRVIIHATDRPASHTHEMWVLGEAVSPALEEFETPQ